MRIRVLHVLVRFHPDNGPSLYTPWTDRPITYQDACGATGDIIFVVLPGQELFALTHVNVLGFDIVLVFLATDSRSLSVGLVDGVLRGSPL